MAAKTSRSGAGIDELVPHAELTRSKESNSREWTATGTNPQFTIDHSFPAGWLRLRLKMHSSVASQAELFLDTGNGFVAAECIRLGEIDGTLEIDFYLNPKSPVRAVRFDPLEKPGVFRIERFSLTVVPPHRLFIRSIGTKLDEMRHRGNRGAAFKHGLHLLMSGNFGTFKSKLMQSLGATKPGSGVYEHWRNLHKIGDADRERMRAAIKTMAGPPLISVLLPVFEASETNLRGTFESLLRQIYPHWEVCAMDDASRSPHVAAILKEYSERDPRIKFAARSSHGGFAVALNEALEMAAGSFVARVDQDDELSEHALFKVAETLNATRDLDFIYSDEDEINPEGWHVKPFFKPDWSPEHLLAAPYTGRLAVFRTALARELGGFRAEFEGAHDYDLVLRTAARTRRIFHIPDVLYHRRVTLAGLAEDARAQPVIQKALVSCLNATGKAAVVEAGMAAGTNRVRFAIKGSPRVSIIIPSTCKPVNLKGRKTSYVTECVRSILEKSTFKNFEIIVLDRNQMPPQMQHDFEKSGVRRVSYSDTFNWSRVNNLGASNAAGDHYLFLNDDIEIITPGWLESLLEFSQQDEVGAVGARLLFPNGRLQHGGVFLLGGIPGHQYYDSPGTEPGYFNCNIVHRNYSAVTGACLMTRADVFRTVGGFNEDFWLNYNDVDYCLKIVSGGRRVVYTPYAQCFHHESVTKSGTYAEELAAFKKKWHTWSARDPYFSEHSLELSKG